MNDYTTIVPGILWYVVVGAFPDVYSDNGRSINLDLSIRSAQRLYYIIYSSWSVFFFFHIL